MITLRDRTGTKVELPSITVDDARQIAPALAKGWALCETKQVTETRDVEIAHEAAPVAKAKRAYRPRADTENAVLSVLYVEKGFTADELAKASRIDKATTARVLAYLADNARAVCSDGLWRRMPGA